MYGKTSKCAEQLDSDKDFILECDKIFNNRKVAAEHHIEWAWSYYYNNEFDSAIMRFNQAWLLDSLNADVYWGFGNIVGMKGQFNESLEYLEISLKLNPDNARVWESASTSYGRQFNKTKNQDLLAKSIKYLKKSVMLDPISA